VVRKSWCYLAPSVDILNQNRRGLVSSLFEIVSLSSWIEEVEMQECKRSERVAKGIWSEGGDGEFRDVDRSATTSLMRWRCLSREDESV
jgi:hypothetical protein